MNLTYQFRYSAIDQWTPVWNPAINPTKPTFYTGQNNPDWSTTLIVSGPAVSAPLTTGSGGLLKAIISDRPTIPFSQLATDTSVLVDDSPARQYVEIDRRVTMPDGLTYPGDLHIARDGTISIGDIQGNWNLTKLKIPPFSAWVAMPILILTSYNFTPGSEASTMVSIKAGSTVYPIGATFPAANIGWSPTDFIVEQHQIDQTAQGGTCTTTFGPTIISGS